MPASNEEFIKRAFEAGLTESQVRSAVAERNQRLQTQPNLLKQVGEFFAPNVTKAVTKPQEYYSQSTNIAQQPKGLLGALQYLGARAKEDIGIAGEVAPYIPVPGTQLTKATPLMAGVKTAVTQGIPMALSQASQAKSPEEALTKLITTPVTSGVVGAGAQKLANIPGEIVSKITSGKGKMIGKAKDIYASTLKDNIRDEKFLQQAGGVDKVINDAIRLKIPATKDAVERELSNFGTKYNKIITSEAAKLQNQGKSINITAAFERAMKKVGDQFSFDQDLLQSAGNWFEKNMSKYANQTSAKPISSNKLRVKLDQRVGDILTPDAVGADAARKAFATELRQEFKKLASGETKDAIRRYQLLSGLSDAMRKEPTTSLPEMLGAIVGAPKGLLGNVAGFVATKAMRSPGLRRALSEQAIKGAIKLKPSLPNPQELTRGVTLPINTAMQRFLGN